MTPPKLVCVIDDDELVRRTLCAHLENAGFTTLQATNGAEGLKLILKSQAPIAIVDIVMPDHEGISLIQNLKSQTPSTRILAISGSGPQKSNNYLKIASAMGADDTLEKPFGATELIERIKRLS
ncbi:MAG: response regulator [Micropepsaceae bacterium]